MFLRPTFLNEFEKKPLAFLLIRMIVGFVFLSEGVQKFLFSD